MHVVLTMIVQAQPGVTVSGTQLKALGHHIAKLTASVPHRSTDLDLPGVDTYAQSSKVFFRDAILPASESEEEDSEPSEPSMVEGLDPRVPRAPATIRRKQRVDRQKLIIILVGLPGRGKTFLCNKLMCYLNWCVVTPSPIHQDGSYLLHYTTLLPC